MNPNYPYLLAITTKMRQDCECVTVTPVSRARASHASRTSPSEHLRLTHPATDDGKQKQCTLIISYSIGPYVLTMRLIEKVKINFLCPELKFD